MIFDEFKSLCDGVKASGSLASSPCPITIGDGETLGYYGELNRPLVVVKTLIDQSALAQIIAACAFRYDQVQNATVISRK